MTDLSSSSYPHSAILAYTALYNNILLIIDLSLTGNYIKLQRQPCSKPQYGQVNCNSSAYWHCRPASTSLGTTYTYTSFPTNDYYILGPLAWYCNLILI